MTNHITLPSNYPLSDQLCQFARLIFQPSPSGHCEDTQIGLDAVTYCCCSSFTRCTPYIAGASFVATIYPTGSWLLIIIKGSLLHNKPSTPSRISCHRYMAVVRKHFISFPARITVGFEGRRSGWRGREMERNWMKVLW